MANLEVIALDTVTPQLKAPQAGDGYAMPRPVTVTEVVGSTALTLTGAIQTTAVPVLNATQTWNNAATTFTGIKLNVTDTTSAAASLLMDVQQNGTSIFKIVKSSAAIITNANASFTFATNSVVFGATRQIYLTPGGGWPIYIDSSVGIGIVQNSGTFTFGVSNDLILSRKAARDLQLGAADAATALAQTIGVQSVVAGTSNTNGANFTIRGSQGTGTGVGGSILFQTAPAGGAGTAQNALVTQVTVAGSGGTTLTEVVGASALTLTGATQTTAVPVLNATQTWNNVATTFTGIKLNVTDTTSAAASLLMDLQTGGGTPVSQFSVRKNGIVTATRFDGQGNFTYANFSLAGLAINIQSNTGQIAWGSSQDLILSRKAAASLQFGAPDAAAPVAQTIGPQSVVAGTSNTAGQNLTVRGSQGTGTGVGGDIIFQVASAGSAGTAQNALATAMRVYNTKTVAVGSAFTVATLPAAGTQGRRAWVTDALAPTFLMTLTGGGAVVCPVFDDGTNWVAG